MPDSRARARWATLTQYVSGGAAVLGLLFNLLFYPELQREAQAVAQSGMLVLGVIIGITAQVCLLMWVHRVVRQLNALGPDLGMTPAWAVWLWLIPFLNWWKPYYVMRDIAERLGGMSFVASLPLQLWWGVNVVGRILEKAEGDLLSSKLQALGGTTAEVVGLLSSVFSVALVFLCVRIIKEIQVRLDQRREGLDEVETPAAGDAAVAA
ncbi:DUF4328 domain-containing protein [Corallococcus aberystwythensis]|uniref:DUF4328 domain-containing protein n=1 Tax=Corallococcus aberystwythensis TaxID=2316722 RepID=UPI0013155D63|nr:DUF4328 domain-containing protein [Corallococcus aberystwythensis]